MRSGAQHDGDNTNVLREKKNENQYIQSVSRFLHVHVKSRQCEMNEKSPKIN